MTERTRRFQHHGVEGAVLRAAEDGSLSLNSLLAEGYRRPVDVQLQYPYTACYVLHGARHVLIDAGIDAAQTAENLGALRVRLEDVAWVLITHADWDHVLGLLHSDDRLAYPNARHVLGREAWRSLERPEDPTRLTAERRAFCATLVDRLRTRVILCEGETEVAPGITFVPAPGHRAGNAAYELASRATPLLHLGDSLFQPFQVEEPDVRLEGNADEDAAIETRRRLVQRALEKEALVLASHFPWPGIGEIRQRGGRPVWRPLPTSDACAAGTALSPLDGPASLNHRAPHRR